jgi:hypothetical protein
MWDLACVWRDFQGARGKSGKPAFGFPRFPQLRHFHSSLRLGFAAVRGWTPDQVQSIQPVRRLDKLIEAGALSWNRA